MKFVVAIVLLLLIAIAAFFVGWIQILLPADSHAVVFTKTGGFDAHVTEPGSFTWRWERLVPTNTTLFSFTLEPHSTSVTTAGVLPSGDVYSSVMPGKPDFSYEVTFTLSFRAKPEALPELVSEQHLRPDTLKQWHEDQAAILAHEAVNIMSGLRDESIVYSHSDTAAILRTALEEEFTSIEITEMTPTVVRLPDFELYRTAKRAYLAIAQAQEQAQVASVAELEPQRQREQQTLQVLEQYGKLLASYPVLLDFIDLVTVADDGQGAAGLRMKLPEVFRQPE